MLSPIQLEEHKILSIHFDTRIIESESAPLMFRHGIAVAKQDEQGSRWLVRLDVRFMPETEAEITPYAGEISVAGIFSLSDDFPKEKASEMVHMNAGAILYGTARELLSTITARGLHGPVTLPTMDARCFLPDSTLDSESASS